MNIVGDDETRYATEGDRKLPVGAVFFHEPRIGARYVRKGSRVLARDQGAARAAGARGPTSDAHRPGYRRMTGTGSSAPAVPAPAGRAAARRPASPVRHRTVTARK
ncbi:hypothetical protein ACFU8W_09635 [Streptomyces sp. NPDC057565]|uniref:hypothetical protein n=1 Tax=Streptomyces sp. NPDC057565 TaxID=3346169 RepID=UPI0036C2D77F